MNILSVNNSSDNYGASKSLSRLVKGLVERKHVVHVVMPNQGPLVETVSKYGATVHIDSKMAVIERNNFAGFAGKLRLMLKSVGSFFFLVGLIRKYKIEVVHTNTGVMPIPCLASKFCGVRHVWHVREYFTEFQKLWGIYQHYITGLSANVIVNSNATLSQFSENNREKCVVIYNGIMEDDVAYSELETAKIREALGKDNFIVGVFGRIKWHRKGQEVLVKAVALLRERCPDLKCIVVGTYAEGNKSHFDQLVELIRENNLEDRVLLIGEKRDVFNYYRVCDVTVVPSIAPEPFGCVACESMAVGTAVIGSRCGGLTEQIVNEETGILFEPGNEVELANALESLYKNREKLNQYSQAGKKRAFEVFGHQKTLNEVIQVLETRNQ